MPSFKFASATGSGSSLIVTCSEEFAGKTITCTNGTKTYTRTCPSTSPYEVVFKGIAPGTWTVSGVVKGTTYSQQAVITDFDVTLTTDLFFYKRWVTLGGLDPTDYTDLEDVFADEVAVRRLMTIHASADYLIEKVTDNVDVIDDFVANDTAMKWIGLRDYVCDGLTAITGVEAKFLASQYWERYLKDHVPVMTAASVPYGTAQHYQLFDNTTYLTGGINIGTSTSGASTYYEFTNPICIKAFEYAGAGANTATNYYKAFTAKIEVSNDGSTWTEIGEHTWTKEEHDATYRNPQKYQIANAGNVYAKYVRFRTTSNNYNYQNYNNIGKLQFYGRSLDVSVPVMTSNTAPYGEVIGNTGLYNVLPYVVFNGDSSTQWQSASTTVDSYHEIGYEFINKVVIKNVFISMATYGTLGNGVIQGSNDGNTWEDVYTISSTLDANTNYYFTFSNSVPYKYYRVYGQIVSNRVGYKAIQFYGVDYTEREFAEGSTMKYLYDHGVELEELDSAYTSSTTVDAPTKEDTQIYFATDGNNIRVIGTTNKVDLTDYSYLRMTDGDKGVLDSNSFGGLQVLNAKNTSSGVTSQLSLATMSAMTGNQTLNISSLNAEYYVAVYSSNASRQYSFKELWLE